MAPGGSLIISGVMLDEEAEVLAAFAPRLRLVERLTEDEWMAGRLVRTIPADSNSSPRRTAAR